MRALRLTLLSMTLVVGCGPHRVAEQLPLRHVVVDNQGFADMNIYVIEGARTFRLGVAPGATVTNLTLPRQMSAGVRRVSFRCDPIGGTRASFSMELMSAPDETIKLTIPPG